MAGIIKNRCIWKFGTWLEGLINVLLLGRGKDFAGWVAWKFFKTHDCGCERRRIFLDNLFNCSDDIKLF